MLKCRVFGFFKSPVSFSPWHNLLSVKIAKWNRPIQRRLTSTVSPAQAVASDTWSPHLRAPALPSHSPSNNNNGRAAIHSDTQKRPWLWMRNNTCGGDTCCSVCTPQRQLCSLMRVKKREETESKKWKRVCRPVHSLMRQQCMMRREHMIVMARRWDFPPVINIWWHWQGDSCTCLNSDTESTARSKELPNIMLCPLCARRRHCWKTAAGAQLSWPSLQIGLKPT